MSTDQADILQALDLPPAAQALFLAHIAAFCQQHGATRRYADLLALIEKYQPTEG
jgi:hypothetical protein